MSNQDIYIEMIDATLRESIPAQVAALSEARKENAAELEKLQAALSDLEGKIARGKEEKNRLAVEVNGLLSKINALEEEGKRRRFNSNDLEKEILKVSSLNADLKWKLVQKEDECKATEKKCMMYGEKLDLMKRKAGLYENVEDVMKELKMIRRLTSNMVARKESLEKSSIETKMDDSVMGLEETKDIELLKTSVDEQKILHESKLKELHACQQERKQLEMDNHILQKKNTALLIRLSNQVKVQHKTV